MKKRILISILLILALTSALALSSCDQFSLPGLGDDTAGTPDNTDKPPVTDGGDQNGQTPGGDNSGEENPDDEKPDDEEPEEPVTFTVTYVYNDVGLGETVTFLKQTVDSEKGFTEEQLDYKDTKLYNGYELEYYSDEDCTVPFDFSKKITENTKIYCDRDLTKAGKNVSWEVELKSNGNYRICFYGEGDMYRFMYFDTDVPWRDYSLLIDEIYIEEGITSIANCAFYRFSEIGSVTLPESMVFIGDNAFFESSITDINFPDALETIGKNAFKCCNGLVHLNFNKGLKRIDDSAFYQCASIETVVLTDTIMVFGTSAFQECTGLSSAYYIGTEEQYKQINIRLDNFWIRELAHTYFISEEKPEAPGPYWYYDNRGVIRQWYYTIWYMANNRDRVPFTVDYVDVSEGVNQDNVDFINNIVYHGYKFVSWKLNNVVYDMKVGEKYEKDIKLVGDRGDLCGDNVRWRLRNNVLTLSKVDPSIDDGRMWDFQTVTDAPWYNKSIREVDISDGVTYIGQYAFCAIFNTSVLYADFSYIDIPTYVTEINANAFSGCEHLLYIYYHGSHLDLHGDENTEPKIKGLTSLAGGHKAIVYAKTTPSEFATLGEGAYWSEIVGSDSVRRVAWQFEDGELIVGGGDKSQILINFVSHEQTPWFSYRDDVKTVRINDNITTIGHHSFEGMTSVTAIYVPKIIRKTSATAFVGTGYYNKMMEENGAVYVYNIDYEDGTNNVFRFGHLIRVNPETCGEYYVIPEKTLSIAEEAFFGCSSLKNLVMTKDIANGGIYSTAFNGLTGLENLFYEGTHEAFANYDNTLMGAGQLLSGVKVYAWSYSKPATPGLYWKWSEGKTEPVIWTYEET